jgi:hypothetical protein
MGVPAGAELTVVEHAPVEQLPEAHPVPQLPAHGEHPQADDEYDAQLLHPPGAYPAEYGT